MNDSAIYILSSFVTLLIVLFIAKAVFSISKFLSYQKMQTLLLAKMAKQLGVPADQVDTVVLERLYQQKNAGNITDTYFHQEKKRLLGD
jgi:hypothetical protein